MSIIVVVPRCSVTGSQFFAPNTTLDDFCNVGDGVSGGGRGVNFVERKFAIFLKILNNAVYHKCAPKLSWETFRIMT